MRSGSGWGPQNGAALMTPLLGVQGSHKHLRSPLCALGIIGFSQNHQPLKSEFLDFRSPCLGQVTDQLKLLVQFTRNVERGLRCSACVPCRAVVQGTDQQQVDTATLVLGISQASHQGLRALEHQGKQAGPSLGDGTQL